MADPIAVILLHNQNPMAMLDGYSHKDPLTVVYRDAKHLPYRVDAEVSLDYIYAENQWVDNDHRPWYDDARSLSKGDVIVLHDKAYAIGTVGFQEVEISVKGLVL